jgi:hypothetical protein
VDGALVGAGSGWPSRYNREIRGGLSQQVGGTKITRGERKGGNSIMLEKRDKDTRKGRAGVRERATCCSRLPNVALVTCTQKGLASRNT